VIKYAGGKRQIMKILIEHFPSEFGNYFEPFVGGGSVFMEMENRGMFHNKKVYLSDTMYPLMNMYKVISTRYIDLKEELSRSCYSNDKESYINNRSRFNMLKVQGKDTNVELAALFIYLNKVGFNGIYRENSKGEYNIPFGRNKTPTLFDNVLFSKLATFLKNELVHIARCSYEQIQEIVLPGDFVYMDPPYYNTFTGYNAINFGEDEQVKLRDFYEHLSNKGCKVALSNSDTAFIRTLYGSIPGVTIVSIPVKRLINSKSEERKNVKTELLIKNY